MNPRSSAAPISRGLFMTTKPARSKRSTSRLSGDLAHDFAGVVDALCGLGASARSPASAGVRLSGEIGRALRQQIARAVAESARRKRCRAETPAPGPDRRALPPSPSSSRRGGTWHTQNMLASLAPRRPCDNAVAGRASSLSIYEASAHGASSTLADRSRPASTAAPPISPRTHAQSAAMAITRSCRSIGPTLWQLAGSSVVLCEHRVFRVSTACLL